MNKRHECEGARALRSLLSAAALIGWGVILSGPGASPVCARTPPGQAVKPAAPKYAMARAWHILPETHNQESGYFSLCEGVSGAIYIGTAKYGENAFLVEFDPGTEKQRIVIDTHRLCGLTATGYAAQAKIHTRNFVGPSGTIYVGSKQGHPSEADKTHNVRYPGGYVMTYDPATGEAEDLGRPWPATAANEDGEGVIDVVADESRGLLYVVTCENQHWMIYDRATKEYREPGPDLRLAPCATTLVDSRGVASAIAVAETDEPATEEGFNPQRFRLAQYNPATGKVTTRDLTLDGRKWLRGSRMHDNLQWALAPDGRTAWLVRLGNATMISIDLPATGPTAAARSRGTLIEGEGIDIRSGLAFHPDGRIYAVSKVIIPVGNRRRPVSHLLRFDPATGKGENLGAIGISNPEFYTSIAFDSDGKKKRWHIGFEEMPDGTLVGLYNLGLVATRDGTLYATQLYPFALLRIEQFRIKEMP